MEIKTFEDLDCWKLSAEIRKELSHLVKGFPKEERFLLVDQIKRASRSVTANIAEGYGRYHYQEYIQFCRQSRGSLYEVIDHLLVAEEEGYITSNVLQDYKTKIVRCVSVLNGFINHLERSKASKQKNTNASSEPEMEYALTINH